jgi:hypothetical protein
MGALHKSVEEESRRCTTEKPTAENQQYAAMCKLLRGREGVEVYEDFY